MISELENTMQGKRRRMIQATNLLLFAMVVALAAYKFIELGFAHPPLPAVLIALLTLANSLYIFRKGSLRIATWMIFAILLFGLIISGINTGAFSGPTVLLSPILPVLAMLLMSATAGWVAMLLVGGILTGLFVMELNGLILPNPHDAQGILISRYLSLISTLGVCTWVAWTFAEYLKELVLIINNQANTDYLTGIANRRSLEAAMLRETGRARRNDTWLSLIMTDVDHFKRFNDKNGHPAGDRCLVKVAQTLASSAKRPSDFVGRFGGEEFIVMLPDTDHSGACKVANEIRRNMLKQQLHYQEDSTDTVSLTLGVVTVRGRHIKSIDQLIREADNALYYGKGQGRNCVIGICLNEIEEEEELFPEYVKCA